MKNINNRICFFMIIAFVSSCQSDNDITGDNEINKNSVAYTNIDIIDGISTMILKDQTIIINKATGEILDLYNTSSKTLNENNFKTFSIYWIKDFNSIYDLYVFHKIGKNKMCTINFLNPFRFKFYNVTNK